MKDIQKNAMLYDFYEKLLTDKQKEYFELYYFDNYTFQEISEFIGISRNAVHDSIKKTISLLNEYEKKLQLVKKYILTEEIYKKYIDSTNCKELIENLKNIEKE